MFQISEAAWKEIIKNKPSKITAFDIYKDFCKNLHGSEITFNQIKMDWDNTITVRQMRELQKKADLKNQEHEKNIENWLKYYGVTQQNVDDYLKEMKKKKAHEKQENKRNLSQKSQQEFQNDENQQCNESKPKVQVILRKVKKENKQPTQKSISPEDTSTNQIIHQVPILVRMKNVQLEKETPIHKQRSQKQVRFEQVKEDSPFQYIKSDQKPIRITD